MFFWKRKKKEEGKSKSDKQTIITIEVVDENKNPIKDAKVIVPTGEGESIFYFTDENGICKIKLPITKEFVEIEVIKEGYEKRTDILHYQTIHKKIFLYKEKNMDIGYAKSKKQTIISKSTLKCAFCGKPIVGEPKVKNHHWWCGECSGEFKKKADKKTKYDEEEKTQLTKKPNIIAKTAEDWYNLGKEYYSKGNYKKAIECFDKALEINPHFVEAEDARWKAWISTTKDCQKRIVKSKLKELIERAGTTKGINLYYIEHLINLGYYDGALSEIQSQMKKLKKPIVLYLE